MDRPTKRERPGSSWRIETDMPNGDPCVNIQSTGHSIVNEVVISPWLHVEQMDEDQWWVRLGERKFWVHVNKDGTVGVEVAPQ